MKRNKHAISVLAVCLFSTWLICPGPARAQEQDQPAAPAEDTVQGQAQGQQSPTAAEMVTDYLEQDIFLRPGIGLKKVHVGMRFKDVLKAWGPPTEKGGSIVIANKWTYQVGDHTKIKLAGNETVDEITIAGGVSSPYVTTEGASFGMAQYQLATIYGSAPEKDDQVVYKQRGIGFVLDQGQVSEMHVFSPH